MLTHEVSAEFAGTEGAGQRRKNRDRKLLERFMKIAQCGGEEASWAAVPR
jgi:hypothetical protein